MEKKTKCVFHVPVSSLVLVPECRQIGNECSLRGDLYKERQASGGNPQIVHDVFFQFYHSSVVFCPDS